MTCNSENSVAVVNEASMMKMIHMAISPLFVSALYGVSPESSAKSSFELLIEQSRCRSTRQTEKCYPHNDFREIWAPCFQRFLCNHSSVSHPLDPR